MEDFIEDLTIYDLLDKLKADAIKEHFDRETTLTCTDVAGLQIWLTGGRVLGGLASDANDTYNVNVMFTLNGEKVRLTERYISGYNQRAFMLKMTKMIVNEITRRIYESADKKEVQELLRLFPE